jgi:excinuclease ABC subunit C
MMKDLKEKIKELPKKAGIYFFKNAMGKVIYIGKARLLNERVKSYFQPTEDVKVRSILAETADLDYILTGSEREAAFLENNFIQQYQPKFNLRLKDDKSFPYLKLTVTERFPRIAFSRKVAADGAKYFGPFSPAFEARRAIHLSCKYFKVRNCDEEIPGRRKRPCLEYDLKLCSAPCVGYITEEEYRKSVDQALLFLEGKTEQLARILKDSMTKASENKEFEEAARLRDILRTLEYIKIKPKMISIRQENQDIFGFARQGRAYAFDVFTMRRGKVRNSLPFVYENEEERRDSLILQDFVLRFYDSREVPQKVFLPFESADKKEMEDILGSRAGRRIDVIIPSRGKNKDLIELAAKNAEILLKKKTEDLAPLKEIQEELCLEVLPVRIEGFDISNTGGTETVASLVTFENGRPDKDGYRKFTIKTVEGPNDVACLEEVLRRRYVRILRENVPLPDLILVDGGKPQLGAAQNVLAELGLEKVPLVSLAKKEEVVFMREHKDGLRLSRTSAALKLFQHVRDEAHRFAIGFHRRRRTKRTFA